MRVLGCCLALTLLVTVTAVAQGDPAVDAVPRGLPYSGLLEQDGVPLTGPMEFEFTITGRPSGDSFTETQSLSVYDGVFQAVIGEDDASLEAMVVGAESLNLSIQVREVGAGSWVPLTGSQEIFAAPYAVWASNSSNLEVAGDLHVVGNSDLDGDVTVMGTTDVGIIQIEEARVGNSSIINATIDFTASTWYTLAPVNVGRTGQVLVSGTSPDASFSYTVSCIDSSCGVFNPGPVTTTVESGTLALQFAFARTGDGLLTEELLAAQSQQTTGGVCLSDPLGSCQAFSWTVSAAGTFELRINGGNLQIRLQPIFIPNVSPPHSGLGPIVGDVATLWDGEYDVTVILN